MRLAIKSAIGLALFSVAAPALAGDADCVANADSSIGSSLIDQFFFDEGIGEEPAPYFENMQSVMMDCQTKLAVTDENSILFAEMNISQAMLMELRKRLTGIGVDSSQLDAAMAPHIAGIETTFDDMFDHVEADFEERISALVAGGVDQTTADALVGTYSGAYHANVVARLQWDKVR